MASDSNRRRWLYYPAIVLFSSLASVALVEFFLGLQRPSAPVLPFHNELYPYVMFRPHSNLKYTSSETHKMSHHRDHIYHYTNVDGFRVPFPGYSLPKKKPFFQLRIAVLGASSVELGSTYEQTLPGSLRTLLRDRYPGRNIEVINAAIQSCVSRQSIAHLVFTVVNYEPDIVILYDGVNDIGMPLTYESRSNFPYNFQTMVEAWDTYRDQQQKSLLKISLDRSLLYGRLRALWEDEGAATTTSTVALGLGKAPNAISAKEVTSNSPFTKKHIAAYLKNWRRLIELSKAFNFSAVCILQPTGGLDQEHSLPLMMRDFGINRITAAHWIKALTTLNREADSQIETLKEEYLGEIFLNLRGYLEPAKDHFWDMVHVYDKTNMKLAKKIYWDIKPLIEAKLSTNSP